MPRSQQGDSSKHGKFSPLSAKSGTKTARVKATVTPRAPTHSPGGEGGDIKLAGHALSGAPPFPQRLEPPPHHHLAPLPLLLPPVKREAEVGACLSRQQQQQQQQQYQSQHQQYQQHEGKLTDAVPNKTIKLFCIVFVFVFVLCLYCIVLNLYCIEFVLVLYCIVFVLYLYCIVFRLYCICTCIVLHYIVLYLYCIVLY